MKRVLIVCTGNSCRSQMAEGLFRELGSGEWNAYSAGSSPAGYVHPLAIEAMRKRGIDIGAYRSKSLSEFEGEDFDGVITVCDNAQNSCPHFPGARNREHWPFDDPAEATGKDDEKLAEFERVRDEIEEQIQTFLNASQQN